MSSTPRDVFGRLRGSRPQPQELNGDEWVSQRVVRGPGAPADIDGPRPKDQGSVSAFLGRVPPDELMWRVRKSSNAPGWQDGARYAQISVLRQRGFSVHHDPTARNADHVQVRYPEEWDLVVAEVFRRCFEPAVWHGEEPR